MNWGWKITIVYTTFAIGILTMVFMARSQKVDLVAPDYYAQELAFSQRIQARQNTETLNSRITIVANGKQLHIQLPAECSAITKGSVELYCPSNAAFDRNLELKPDANQSCQFDLSETIAGHYIVRLNFEMNGKSYYSEQAIEIG